MGDNGVSEEHAGWREKRRKFIDLKFLKNIRHMELLERRV